MSINVCKNANLLDEHDVPLYVLNPLLSTYFTFILFNPRVLKSSLGN